MKGSLKEFISIIRRELLQLFMGSIDQYSFRRLIKGSLCWSPHVNECISVIKGQLNLNNCTIRWTYTDIWASNIAPHTCMYYTSTVYVRQIADIHSLCLYELGRDIDLISFRDQIGVLISAPGGAMGLPSCRQLLSTNYLHTATLHNNVTKEWAGNAPAELHEPLIHNTPSSDNSNYTL